MRVLLTGANGFVGGHVLATLQRAGHEIVAAVRNPRSFSLRHPGVNAVRVDMNRDTRVRNWLQHLDGIDAVINCAGVLQSGRGQDTWKIHAGSPKALFDACVQRDIRRVIQVSAISADAEAGTDFARSKKAADDYLRSLDLDWLVLRPSLIYSEGSFGGTSTLRGLAALPGFVPLIGDGSHEFQPLHADDLAAGIAWLLEHGDVKRATLSPAGPETFTVRELILRYRRWLGFGSARLVALPMALIRLLARIGDMLGVAAINSTALKQLEYGNTTNDDWTAYVPIRCRKLDEALQARPAQVQDRWHARLYFLKPLLRVSLVLLWLGSAFAGSFVAVTQVAEWLAPFGLETFAAAIKWLSIALDTALGLWLLTGRRLKLSYVTQFWLVLVYTLVFSFAQPLLWLSPLGELLKNIPVLVLIAVGWMTADER